MINSSDLNSFLTTARMLHLTKAAKELGLSQPALSHCIKRLELEVGEELFLRRKDGLILTKSGEYLLLKGQKICAELEGVSEFFKTGRTQSHQTLTLGIHPSVASYSLPQIMKELKNIKLNFRFGLSREVSDWIQDGKVDCGIVINPYPHSNLVINQIDQDRVTLWSHKKLSNPDKLFFDPQLHQTHSILRQLEKKGIQFPNQYAVSNLELIAKFVYEGTGVGILPEKVVKNYYSDLTKIYNSEIKPFQDKICFIYSMENKGLGSLEQLKMSIKKVLT
ncbi:MAG: LysR family transcriptional regulator [Bacteriovorax sp.]|nr:LysR family transcriptional regulator [Bacteriovorax sp.]